MIRGEWLNWIAQELLLFVVLMLWKARGKGAGARIGGFQPPGEAGFFSPAAKSRRSLLKAAAPWASLDGAGQFAFPQQASSRPEARLDRIAADVADAIDQVIAVADQPVEIIAHPQGAAASQQEVDLSRRETFPRLENFLEHP